ncbi:MAG: 2-amino-4-hydroxy-6-hydroxymethyldihydropteridine diphosphokinase [Dokdonella sp.]
MSETSEVHAWIGLGSNLDNPPQQLRRALAALANCPRTRLLKHSRLYRTAPWGIADQPAFVNAVAELATSLSPRELLETLLAIECRHGRRRDGSRWGPRTLDLDLLMYSDIRIDEPGLTVPHPRMVERAFVLMPLAELDADLAIPGVGIVGEMLAQLDVSGCASLVATNEMDSCQSVEP